MVPLISIVIANYNYGRFLEEAILSILSQELGERIEIIICDAGSTDNSLEIIRKYEKHITWWCSEKDGGQSAAFNKGFSHARGEWLTWLNADDMYLPGTLKAFATLVARKPKAQWVTGNKIHFDSDSKAIISVNWGPHRQLPILSGRRAFSAVFGPTTFWRRSLYEEIGPIDERLHFAMDTEYWARLTMAGVGQVRLNRFCWAFRDHADSKTEGVQTEDIRLRRAAETAYWREKTGYNFEKSIRNVYYVLWVLWRFFDGSWFVRAALKLRYEGRNISALLENMNI